MGMFEDQKNIWGNLIKGFSNNPNNRQLANTLKEGTRQAIGLTVADIPLSAKEAYDYAQKGEYLNSGLSAAAMIPGVPALGGLVKGQNIYRGTKRVPDLQEVSQRFKNPGNEFGTHVSVDPNTADLMQYNYRGGTKGGIIAGESNVSKPLILPDTKGRWAPNTVIDSIFKNKQNITGVKTKQINVGTDTNPTLITTYVLPKALEDDLLVFKNRYNTIISKQGETTEVIEAGTRELQELLRKNGFDHISYTNAREGTPSESAILFNREDISNPLLYKDPFTDTTK